MKRIIRIRVNHQDYELDVEPNQTLLQVIRNRLGLTGTKGGCHEGDCGACTVIMDGEPVNSCLVLAVQADGRVIETIEGLGTEADLHPLQKAFIEKGAVQCGFCTPGMILTAKSLMDKNPEAGVAEIRKALAGNLCRCSGYQKIVQAVGSLTEKNDS